MRLAHIVPTAYLDMVSDRAINMALAHLWGDEVYRNFYLNTPGLLLLDNGLYENSQIDEPQLYEIIAETLAFRRHKFGDESLEIVAPDTLYDGVSTVERSVAFVKQLRDSLNETHFSNLRVMLVPQGQTAEEWETCLKDLIAGVSAIVHPSHMTLALSKLSCPQSFAATTGNPYVSLNRLEAYRVLRQHWEGQVHLLGAGVPQEWVHYAEDQSIRSCDTSLAAQLAVRNLNSWKDTFPTIDVQGMDTHLNFDEVDETVYRELLFQHMVALDQSLYGG